MINWIKENKWKILVVVVVYLIVCVNVIGGFMTAYHFAEGFEKLGQYNTRLEATKADWATYGFKPFTVIDTMFDGGSLQNGFLTICVIVLAIFIFLSVKIIMMSRKQHENQSKF